MVKGELSFESEVRRSLLAFPMHFTEMELTDIRMIIREDQDAFNVRQVIFKISKVSLLVRSPQLAIALLKAILNIPEELLCLIGK